MLDAVLLAAGTAVVVGLLGAALVRWQAQTSLARAAVLTPVVVIVIVTAGIVATAQGMFISEHDHHVVLAVLATCLPIAGLFGWFIAGRVQEVVRRSVTEAAERERDREVEARRRELVAWMSHDLRTPLAGIRAMAEALGDGRGPRGLRLPRTHPRRDRPDVRHGGRPPGALPRCSRAPSCSTSAPSTSPTSSPTPSPPRDPWRNVEG